MCWLQTDWVCCNPVIQLQCSATRSESEGGLATVKNDPLKIWKWWWLMIDITIEWEYSEEIHGGTVLEACYRWGPSHRPGGLNVYITGKSQCYQWENSLFL